MYSFFFPNSNHRNQQGALTMTRIPTYNNHSFITYLPIGRRWRLKWRIAYIYSGPHLTWRHIRIHEKIDFLFFFPISRKQNSIWRPMIVNGLVPNQSWRTIPSSILDPPNPLTASHHQLKWFPKLNSSLFPKHIHAHIKRITCSP